MDDLLSLMENGGAGESNAGFNNTAAGSRVKQAKSNNPYQTKTTNRIAPGGSLQKYAATSKILSRDGQPRHDSAASTSELISKCIYSNFRLSNREVSEEEVTNKIESMNATYLKIAQFSTMSTRALEGQRALSSVATIGVVSKTSGSKLSRSGNAFCIFEVASLFHNGLHVESVNMMSAFIFGEAYGNHNMKVKAGDVVLLLDPELMSATQSQGGSGSNNSKTLQSFKLYESSQLIKIGTSYDHSVAMSSQKKKPHGNSTTFSKAKPPNNMTKMQQLRDVHGEANSNQFRMGGSACERFNPVIASNPMRQKAVSVVRHAPLHMTKKPNNVVVNSQINPAISALSAAGARTSNANPLATLNNRRSNVSAINSSRGMHGSTFANAFSGNGAKGQASLQLPHRSLPQQISSNTNQATLNTLHKQTQQQVQRGGRDQYPSHKQQRSSLSLPSKTAKRPLDLKGAFDGSVPIPQASKSLLSRTSHVVTPEFSQQERQNKREHQRQVMLRSQKEMAHKLNETQNGQRSITTTTSSPRSLNFGIARSSNTPRTHISIATGKVKMVSNPRPRKQSSIRGSTLSPSSNTNQAAMKVSNNRDAAALLFGSNSSNNNNEKEGSQEKQDMAAILNAKSIFSEEVDAHVYAKSRQNMMDLEHREKMEDDKKNNDAKKDQGVIVTEYHCQNCQCTYKKKPKPCIYAGHKVSQKRRIVQEALKTNNVKKALVASKQKDGGGDEGLTLGQGIEWTEHQFL
jgi:hypothetical protein